MVPLDRAMTSFYARLSIVAMSLCAAVWPQFSMQCFNLSVTVFEKRLALLSDSWAFCLQLL